MNRFKDGLLFGLGFSISALFVFGISWVIYTNIQNRIFESQLQQLTTSIKQHTPTVLAPAPKVLSHNEPHSIATITAKSQSQNHLSPKQQKECSLLIMQYSEDNDPALKHKIDHLCN